MTYEHLRQSFQPAHIKVLLIAESPPPAAEVQSSRHFYRAERVRTDDRLFTNTIKALYPETEDCSEKELETAKASWLRRFQHDGWYMIEALEDSQPHEATKKQRQEGIHEHLPQLLDRVKQLAEPHTKIILVKSNVFTVATDPLRDNGFTVLNQQLLDYPGHFNQKAYRTKLRQLIKKHHLLP